MQPHVGSRTLVRGAYARNTLRKYDAAVSAFLHWVKLNAVVIPSLGELDEYLCDYFMYLFEEGEGRAKALDTMYGIVALFPAWRRAFPTASQSLKGWLRMDPVVSRPPLTWELTLVIAVEAAKIHHPLLSLAFLLAFDCLLRINEVLALEKGDIAGPGDDRLLLNSDKLLIRLKVTKTGKQQWVQVRRPLVASWLRGRACALQLSQMKLFPYTATVARDVFKRAALGAVVAIVVRSPLLTPWWCHGVALGRSQHGGYPAEGKVVISQSGAYIYPVGQGPSYGCKYTA